jgi:diaminohydroxyphosphoribosylaminopyrimidine deaminase/5-amino-6-(5-phosphoribosylamino)uracil reductase
VTTPSGTIDEGTAWALLLRAADRDVAAEPVTAIDPGEPAMTIDPDGSWRAERDLDVAARFLFDLFAPLLARPDVLLGQLGQSLDGRIATQGGSSHYVTGTADIERLHRSRALVDAVVVGAGTVIADDPRLSVRAVQGVDPVRVVIDPRGRTPADRHVFSGEGAETLWVTSSDPDEERSATVVLIPLLESGVLDLGALVTSLRSRGLRRILIEGGGVTVSRFLEAGLLDRLHVAVAPLLIGSGRPSITLPVIDSLDDALRPTARHFRLGDDHLFDLDLRTRPPADR